MEATEDIDKISRIDKDNFLLTCADGWFEIWTCPIPDKILGKTVGGTHIRMMGEEVMGNIELHTYLVSGYGVWKNFRHLDSVVEFCEMPVKQSLIKEESD